MAAAPVPLAHACRVRALKSRQASSPAATRRFPAIALKWAAALLRHCDEPQHGVDLLGRDSFLLGKLLVTLGERAVCGRACVGKRATGGGGSRPGRGRGQSGHQQGQCTAALAALAPTPAARPPPARLASRRAGAFLEAAAQSSEAATLAAATLELMRLPRVHAHPEPYVRRAALLAAGQVLGAVPPARLATAMLGAAAGGAGALAAPRDAADEALVARLEWLREWAQGVAGGDPDDSCRMMAEGVQKLQGHLASGALAALDSGVPAGPLAGGSLLPLGGGGGGGGRGGPGLGLPDIGSLSLPDIRLP